MSAQNSYYQSKLDYSLSRGIRWSIIAHVVFVVLIVLKNLILPSNVVPYIPTLRVDIVGLPDVLKKDLAKIPEKSGEDTKAAPPEDKTAKSTKEAAEKAAKDEMVLKKRKEAEAKKEAERKAEQARLEKLKEEKQREEKMKAALDRIKALNSVKEDQALVKGNIVSPGTTLTGDAKESAVASYNDLILDRLRRNWALPVWLARQNLAARVLVRIDRTGRVAGYVFTQHSGNAQFDDAIRQTLAKSAPFPPPPSDASAAVLTDGILLGFPL